MIKQIEKALLEARKTKSDSVRVLSTLLAQVKLEAKKKNRELSKEEVLTVISKNIKGVKETKELAKDRPDIIENCNRELNILNQFLPKQLTEDELKDILTDYIAKENIVKDKKMIGTLMKYLKDNYSGQYDGKIASNIIKSI